MQGKLGSHPETIFLTFDNGLVLFGIRLAMGENRSIVIAAWNVVDSLGHNQAGFYAHFESNKSNLSDPIEFAKGVGIDAGMGIRYPEIIEYQGEVIIMYNNGIPPTGVPPGEWFVRSKDGGKTWSPQIRAFHQHVGRNGDISFVVDSKGSLHVLFGNRIPITVNGVYDAIGGIWHSELLGNSWSEPDAIIAMTDNAIQAYALENPNSPAFAPFNARAVISQGNVLLVTWMTDQVCQERRVVFLQDIGHTRVGGDCLTNCRWYAVITHFGDHTSAW